MFAKVSLMFFETLFVVASPGSSGILCGLVFLNEATKIERITGGDVLSVLRRADPKRIIGIATAWLLWGYRLSF